MNAGITIDGGNIFYDISKFGAISKNTENLTLQIAQVVRDRWQQEVKKAGYNTKIKIDTNRSTKNSVVVTGGAYSIWMIKGEEEYNMKNDKYLKGKKSRVGKDGKGYLIVPFYHATPSKDPRSMPKEIYADYKQIGLSSVLKTTHKEKNFKGQDIDRAEYSWRGALKFSKEYAAANPSLSKFNGMVSMESVAVGKKKAGTRAFTFRVMSENSPPKSWIRKARKPISNLENILAEEIDNFLDRTFKSI